MIAEKVGQAAELLREFDMPVWIVQFARETYEHPQPVQQLLVGTTVTWVSAFIITSTGDSIAIVGTGDVANVEAAGAYRRVIGYVQDIGPHLREVLSQLDPARIGVSYSLNDESADNITHGAYRLLLRALEGTSFADRIVSAEAVLAAARARKLPEEVERVREAVALTEDLFGAIGDMLAPGLSERAVADFAHDFLARRGLSTAWQASLDPIVNFGPGSPFGHAEPGDTQLAPGMLVHVDLGIKRNGYCSDLQRMWYLLPEGQGAPPPDVQRAFDTVLRSMQAGLDTMRVGTEGWRVDEAARRVIVDAGYEEPEFALGHQLGQTTHDGGTLLGPRWPRYGDRPLGKLESGNIFTVEYGLSTSAGPIGLEEDVVLTDAGPEYLSRPQTELVCLRR